MKKQKSNFISKLTVQTFTLQAKTEKKSSTWFMRSVAHLHWHLYTILITASLIGNNNTLSISQNLDIDQLSHGHTINNSLHY